MKRIVAIAAMFLFLSQGLNAQQDPQYSMYMFNGLYLNPAYAGSHEVISISAIYRHQWAGFEGAPRSASIGVHTPLLKNKHAHG